MAVERETEVDLTTSVRHERVKKCKLTLKEKRKKEKKQKITEQRSKDAVVDVRHERVKKCKLTLKEKRKKEKKQKITEQLIADNLGSKDAVVEEYVNGKRSYLYKCHICGVTVRDKFSRHLMTVHKQKPEEATLSQSEARVMFLWCRSEKHNCPLPAPCHDCNEWYMRIDKHFRNHKKHLVKDEDVLRKMVSDIKSQYWDSGFTTKQVRKRQPENPNKETSNPGDLDNSRKCKQNKTCAEAATNNESDDSDENPEDFTFRSKAIKVLTGAPNVNYIPENAFKISEEDRAKWGISSEDYVTIYYENASAILEAFYNDLVQSSRDPDDVNNAMQHRNKVELIWRTLSEEMILFPKNALANLHLLRNFYHVPTYRMIGRKGGVQASTLRSRFTSLTFFIQFVRKQQIYAGMSRNELSHLEKAVEDFNKELNPHIKQRKIDVRRNKVCHLLTPDHFIRYGRSKLVQNLIHVYAEFKKQPKSQIKRMTRQFAIQFRDFLIASLCIGNGLRASNVMELRLRDFEESKTVPDYPGHRVVTNSSYKTSTIYGEKFIVVPAELFDQYQFYECHLRKKVTSTQSTRVFLPASSTSKKMSQANVSSSLTSSFNLAKIFSQKEYKRVCCTRIRCGIATFACNEGGFDTGFFAKHYMKNREETTSIHYNLLSNRRML